MKVKCLVAILLVLFITGLTGCSDDDNQNKKDRLPETARAFIESRLSGYDILNIKEVDDKGDQINEKYIITFSNDLLVSFSSLGYWRRIKSSSQLPELLLNEIPFGGVAEVKKTYPIATINEINYALYGYQAIMSIGSPIAFYDISSSNKFGVDLTEEKSLWPDKIEEFFNVYYADEFNRNQPFFFIKEKDNAESEYRFGTSSETKVHFDKKGNWYNYEGGSTSLTNTLYEALLPQEMRDIIEQKYSSGANRIYAVLRHENYSQAVFKQTKNSTAIYILFNADTNQEVETPDENTLYFLKMYVGEPSENTDFGIRMMSDSDNTKQFVFQITGSIADKKVLTMYTNMVGKVLQLDLSGSAIPNKILDYLPTKVKEYAEKKHTGKEIMTVVNGLRNEYYILYKEGSRLYFDKEGNVIN